MKIRHGSHRLVATNGTVINVDRELPIATVDRIVAAIEKIGETPGPIESADVTDVAVTLEVVVIDPAPAPTALPDPLDPV